MLRIATPLALICLTLTGCQQFGGLYDLATGQTPLVAARMMESESPNHRWQGINRLVRRDFAQRPPYTDRYVAIAQNDEDPLVRAVAVRALNRSRDAAATPTFIRALSDPSPQVRLEAAKALVNIPDPDAIAPLVQIVTNIDENKDLRIAAADALRHYPRVEVGRALVSQLTSRDFGLAWQSRNSLRALTGQDFRYDETAWLSYLTGENPFG